MAIKIAQIQNLQQLDVLVAGPDDANHLFIIDGQFDATLTIAGQGTSFASGKETFSVLLGPKLTNRQFVRAIATASIVKSSDRQHQDGRICGLEHSRCRCRLG